MAASATDLLQEVGLPGSATTLTANYTIGDSSITVGDTSLMSSATGFTFAIDRAENVTVGGQTVERRIDGTYCEFVGVVSGPNTISSVSKEFGTDQNYTAGSLTRVYIPVSSERENRIVQWGIVSHNQDGTLKDSIVTSAKVNDAAITAPKLATNAISLGSASRTSEFTTSSGSAVQVTSLSSSVTIPDGGRKVEVEVFAFSAYQEGSGGAFEVSIWDGTVGSGTRLEVARLVNIANTSNHVYLKTPPLTVAAGSKTYNVGFQSGSGVAHLEAAATAPAYIAVRVV